MVSSPSFICILACSVYCVEDGVLGEILGETMGYALLYYALATVSKYLPLYHLE